MSVLDRTDSLTIPDASVFESVLCGISGSRSDTDVVRQAAALAGRDGRLTLLAVPWELGTGATAVALLSQRRAEAALKRATATAAGLGIEVAVRSEPGPDAAGTLLDAADDHDLLVIGASGASRMQGMAVGRTGSLVVHRARGPVLVARRPPQGDGFLTKILLATDGSPGSRAAAEIAARIVRVHRSAVAIGSPSGEDAARRHELAEQAALLHLVTGMDPVSLDEHGPPAHAVVGLAPTWEASLIVIGSRRLHGLGAIRSVSERVAHQAACSVLVTP